MVIRSASLSAESQSVNAALQKIEADISNLEVLRIEFRRRKNDLDALTSVLPTETLSTIFEAVCELPEGSPYHHTCYPLVLASVCSRWQKIVYSTPSLWQGLQLRLYHPGRTSRMSLTLLRSYVQRLRALPLSLRVSCNPTARHKHLSRADISPVDDLFEIILEECPEKLGSLVLNNVPRGWWALLPSVPSLSAKFPRLERVAFSWSEKYRDPPIEPFQKHMVPRLKSVSLCGERLPINLPWDQITILELKNMNVWQCIKLLSQCPLLEEYRCQGALLSTVQGQGFDVMREVKIYPHMKHVSWHFGLVGWDIVLMEHVQFPNLRTMSWLKHSYGSSFLDTAENFGGVSYPLIRQRFMSKPQSLTVFKGSLSLWSIEELFKTLPRTLQELYLTDGHGTATLDTFRLLTLSDDEPNTNIFPNLRILSTPFLCPPQPNDCNSATVALKMLQSRREGPSEKWKLYQRIRLIRLICPVPIMYTGWAVHLDELQQLIREGLEVEEEERRFEGATTSVATRVGINPQH